MAESKLIFSKKFWLIFWIISIAAILISGIFDLQIAQLASDLYLNNANLKNFADFMDDEGQYFSYALVGIAFFIYLLSLLPPLEKKLKNLRKYCIYIILVTLFGALLSVRFFKTFFARPRPGKVLSGEFDFVYPLAFGGLDVLKALSSGSFCSGHTATAAVLFTLPFIFLHKRNKLLNILLFIIVLVYVFLMALGRIISTDHWMSDTVCSGSLMFFIAWLFYEPILKINDQEKENFNPKVINKFYWIGFIFFGALFFVSILLLFLDIKIILLPDSLNTNYSQTWISVHPEVLDDAFTISIPLYISVPLLLVFFTLSIFTFDLTRLMIRDIRFKDFILVKIFNRIGKNKET
ncbi:MAG: phosphatase PAP2 family protein [Promethearchaeota archaeon]